MNQKLFINLAITLLFCVGGLSLLAEDLDQELETIKSELGHEKSAIRKAALKKANALPDSRKLTLSSALKQSTDPELRTAGLKISPEAIVKKLDKEFSLNFVNVAGKLGGTKIFRIKNKMAFERLGGGKQIPVDFEIYDLVVVRGSLCSAHGKVRFKTDNATTTFYVMSGGRDGRGMKNIIQYSNTFAVGKNTIIRPYVFLEALPVKNKALERNAQGGKLAHLKNTKKRHLHLSNKKLNDADLADLSKLTHVIQLHMDNNPDITDAGLKHLKPLMTSNMQSISFDGTSITPEGLEKLKKWGAQQPDKNGPQIYHSIVIPQVYK